MSYVFSRAVEVKSKDRIFLNLELAICIHKQVSGLKITVQDIGRMNEFDSTAYLINKVLKVSIGQWLLRTNDLVKIGLHKFLNKVAKLYHVKFLPELILKSALCNNNELTFR